MNTTRYTHGHLDYKGWRCRSSTPRSMTFARGGRTITTKGDPETAFRDITRQIDEMDALPPGEVGGREDGFRERAADALTIILWIPAALALYTAAAVWTAATRRRTDR
jgi:hypothetical protein